MAYSSDMQGPVISFQTILSSQSLLKSPQFYCTYLVLKECTEWLGLLGLYVFSFQCKDIVNDVVEDFLNVYFDHDDILEKGTYKWAIKSLYSSYFAC